MANASNEMDHLERMRQLTRERIEREMTVDKFASQAREKGHWIYHTKSKTWYHPDEFRETVKIKPDSVIFKEFITADIIISLFDMMKKQEENTKRVFEVARKVIMYYKKKSEARR